MKKHFLLLTIILFALNSFAQDQHLVDSLQLQLKKHNDGKLELQEKPSSLYDTTAANILYNLSKSYWDNTPDKAMNYANQCLALSEQIGYKKGIGNSYNSIGVINYMKGDYLPAMEFYKKALKIRDEIGDKIGISWSHNNIGNIYFAQGNFPEALKSHLASLRVREEIGDKTGITASYNNIGIIHDELGNDPEALKNYFAALRIQEEIGDKKGIAATYNNIGVIYDDQGNYPEALKSHFASLKINEETGDKAGIAQSYNNIGIIFMQQGKYPEALKNYFAALKIQEEIGDRYGIAASYNSIGKTYTKEKKYNEAAEYLNKGLSLFKELGSLLRTKESYGLLAVLDSARGNFSKAWGHYKMYIVYLDSLKNKENTKKLVQAQMQYEFDKKESLTKSESEKELQNQKLIRNGFIGGTILFLLLAVAIFIGLRKTGKAKKKSEELLLNILPAEVAEEIKTTGTAKAKAFTMVTVMFTDFKDFTIVSEHVSAELLVDEIHTCFSAFDNILQKHKIEKIKTIGDAYLCASGLPVSNYTHAVDMLNTAFEIRRYMLQRKKEKEAKGEIPFEMRIGIHTGPVVAGVVGIKKYAYDIWGDTVNIAARMEQNSEAGKVNISGSTYELVKDKFKCTYRGKISAKNKGDIDMYFVESI